MAWPLTRIIVIFLTVLVILVELSQRIADILDLDDGTFFAKVERMNVDGPNKARELYLLESVVDEISDGLGKLKAFWACGQGFPVYIDGHYMAVVERKPTSGLILVFLPLGLGPVALRWNIFGPMANGKYL